MLKKFNACPLALAKYRNIITGCVLAVVLGLALEHPALLQVEGNTLQIHGDVRVNGGIVESSDRRLKKHVKTLAGALEKVTRLRGVEYRWRNVGQDQGIQFGLIAQEVEAVVPSVVRTNRQGMKAVAYTQLVGLLVESTKALEQESRRLRLANQALRRRLDALEAKAQIHATR